MYNTPFILLMLLMLQGCANSFSSLATDNSAYFSDALTCYQSSVRKEQIKVPTAGTMSVMEVPVANDPNVFGNCMADKGHTVEKANPDAYLKVSRKCLQAARNATNPDDAYADCVRHGGITVETLPQDEETEQ